MNQPKLWSLFQDELNEAEEMTRREEMMQTHIQNQNLHIQILKIVDPWLPYLESKTVNHAIQVTAKL